MQNFTEMPPDPPEEIFAVLIFEPTLCGDHTHQIMSPLHIRTSVPEIKMAEFTFCFEVLIRGYHVYKDIWTAVVDKELGHRWEPSCVHAHTHTMTS